MKTANITPHYGLEYPKYNGYASTQTGQIRHKVSLGWAIARSALPEAIASILELQTSQP